MKHELSRSETAENTAEVSEISEKTAKHLGKTAVQEYRAGAKERAKEKASAVRKIQEDFVTKVKKREADGKQVSDFALKDAETDLAYAWNYLTDEEYNGGMRCDDEKCADVEEAIYFLSGEEELHRTIEAQLGRFYQERARSLRDAIEASEKSDAQKERDISAITRFEALSEDHIDLKYHEEEYQQADAETWNAYERHRTKVHNDTIDGLNFLNDLAKQYGTKPFTPRDFWSTAKHHANTVAERKRLRYDRDVVEEYYSIAFSRQVEKAKGDFENSRAKQGIGTEDQIHQAFLHDSWERLSKYYTNPDEEEQEIA